MPLWIAVCACIGSAVVGFVVAAVLGVNNENKLRAQIASLYKQLTDEETKHRAIRNL